MFGGGCLFEVLNVKQVKQISATAPIAANICSRNSLVAAAVAASAVGGIALKREPLLPSIRLSARGEGEHIERWLLKCVG